MKFSILFSLTLVAGQAVFGQNSTPDSTLTVAEKLYNGGSYESAELTARHVIEQADLHDSVRIAAERIIAFSLVAQGESALAREHFISILKLNPSFRLDPILTSPKILTVFNETRLRYAASDTSGFRYPGVGETEQRGPSFRSILFPGWEQCYRGRTGIGVSLLSAGAVSLGSGIAFEFLRSSTRRDYLSATKPADIAGKYATYNRYYRIEAYSFIVFAAVYITSEADVFLNGGRTVEVHPAFNPSKGTFLELTLRW